MKKNIIIAILSLIIICGTIVIGMSQFGSNTKEIKEIIASAINATENLNNFEAELSTYTDVKREGEETVQTVIRSNLIYFLNPYKMYISMIILNEAGEEENVFEKYSVYDGQHFAIYTHDFVIDEWNTMAMLNREQFNMQSREYTIKENIIFCLKNADTFTKNGEERIKDYDTIKYTGIFAGSSLRNLYRSMGYIDSVIDGIIEKHSKFDVSFWIDSRSHNVVKYSMDISHIYNYIFERQVEDGVLDNAVFWEKYINEVTVFNFNKAPDFEIPQEALDANIN